MIRAGGITWRGADSPILFLNEILMRQVLAAAITPLFTNSLVQAFRKRFGETIGESFGHNRVVIVMFFFEPGAEGRKAFTGSDGKSTDVIRDSRGFGRDEVRKGIVKLIFGFPGLLAQRMKGRQQIRP